MVMHITEHGDGSVAGVVNADRLAQQIGEANLEAAYRCAERLYKTTSDTLYPGFRALVAYGGGKDSSYMLAFVRLVQKLVKERYGRTFKLRVATNRHAGMVRAVMENIDRVYSALSLYDDPDVELLIIDGNEVTPFDLDLPLPLHIVKSNRLDILMTGHRCRAEARPTFCNSCNLSMARSFAGALSYGEGAELILTGDSPVEQRAYIAWIKQVAKGLGLSKPNLRNGFGGFLQALDEISKRYFMHIYGSSAIEAEGRRISSISSSHGPIFFSIFGDTAYEASNHWEFLTQFLGFKFDDIAFSFTESDCGNPALMAHLRGLRAERLHGRRYQDGIKEYVDFATNLMRQKNFPEHLIQVVDERYRTLNGVRRMRNVMNSYAKEVFDLTEEQLVCMIYSPFAQKGKGLDRYLHDERPEFIHLSRKIRLLFESAETSATSSSLEDELFAWSGLDIHQLRVLYQSNLTEIGFGYQNPEMTQTPISLVLSKDPHKALIETCHSPGGPMVTEWITGR